MSNTNHPFRVLIVEDDAVVADALAGALHELGFDPVIAASGEDAIEFIQTSIQQPTEQGRHLFAATLIDMHLPGINGIEVLQKIRQVSPATACVSITGYGTIQSAVEAMRLGAVDYLTKPIVDAELQLSMERAIRQHSLVAENLSLRAQLDDQFGLDNIVGSDVRMRRIFDVVSAVAPSRTTVLMSGESGTGKSLIARAVHRRSPRQDKPFVELSCGSIPETLLESELFGHVKGAFTGAHADKQGRFLAANGGTIFLDEINSASPGMQLKLLRVLQERKFEPVGSSQTIDVDVRVILASNQPLEELVANGNFRQDLYYRINVVMIQLPPLRDRVSDIPLLAEYFLQKSAEEVGREFIGFSSQAIDAMRRYAFPGNVRELENIIERAVVLSQSPRIGIEDLPEHVVQNSTRGLLPGRTGEPSGWRIDDWQPMPLAEALKEPERQIILAALEANDWNRQKTADDLQINRTTLYKKIKQYSLEDLGRTG